MAKKETTKAPEAVAAQAAATPPAAANTTAAPAAPAVVKRPDVFTFVKQVGKDEKLAPQARVIVNTLETAGAPQEREALCKLLEGKVTTRQPIGRILTYYQKLLSDRGYLTITAAA